MKPLRSKLLVALLLLAVCPLLAAAQSAPQEQTNTPAPPVTTQSTPQMQRNRIGRQDRRPYWGRHRQAGRQFGPGARLAMMLRNPAIREQLGISPEQAARIEAQESTFAKNMIRDRADIRVKRLELAELLAAEKPDRAAIDKKLRELNEVQFAAEKAMVDNRLAMREMLTPEQQQKLQQMFWQTRRGGSRMTRPPAQGQPGS